MEQEISPLEGNTSVPFLFYHEPVMIKILLKVSLHKISVQNMFPFLSFTPHHNGLYFSWKNENLSSFFQLLIIHSPSANSTFSSSPNCKPQHSPDYWNSTPLANQEEYQQYRNFHPEGHQTQIFLEPQERWVHFREAAALWLGLCCPSQPLISPPQLIQATLPVSALCH